MTDVILGMGEVGQTLLDLLVDRKFDSVEIGLDDSKCKKYSDNKIIKNTEYLHVCLPVELTGFTDIALDQIDKIKKILVIIHLAVKPGTIKIIQEKLTIPILFSPVRGVHKRFLNDIKKYTKFILFDGIEIDPKIKTDLENRLDVNNKNSRTYKNISGYSILWIVN